MYFEGISDDTCDVPNCDDNRVIVESDFVESLINRDTLIVYSSKIDPILEEFAGELAHIALTPSGIIEADFDPNDGTSSDDDYFEDIEYVSLEEVNQVDQEKEFDLDDILQIQDVILREKLLNVSRLISNIESLKDNPIPVVDTIIRRDRIAVHYSFLNTHFPEYESFHFDNPSLPRPPPEPPDIEILKPEINNFDVLYNDESFEPGEGENIVVSNVEEDDSFTFTIRTFLPFLTYPEVRIYQKLHKNRQKRASTDTGIRRVQKEAKESKQKPEMSSLNTEDKLDERCRITIEEEDGTSVTLDPKNEWVLIHLCVEESQKTPHFHDDPLHESLHEDSTSQGPSSNVRPSHTLFELNGAVDPTLFTQKAGNDLLLVQIYVDDIIFASTNTALCNEFANLMTTKFKMSMMGQMSFFLGLQISQSPRGIFLNQSKYASKIIKKYGLLTSDSVDTPMVEKNKLDEDLQGTPVDATLYHGMIGSSSGCQTLDVYRSGSAQFLGDKLVSWSSKKQKSTTISSTEAEYIALSGCCAQILWMRSQLTDYGFTFNKIPLYCDNKSAIALCCNNVQHSRAKHINVRYHFIKDQVENGIVELYFCPNIISD
ncbi:retrovirus-related pol polyprotein from transposon TNT 1-94 [Tanacetum coccineum]